MTHPLFILAKPRTIYFFLFLILFALFFNVYLARNLDQGFAFNRLISRIWWKFPLKLAKCAKISQFFVPKKSTGLDAHVEVSRHMSRGTLVTSEPYVPKRNTRFSETVWKRSNEKKKKESAQKLLWRPHLVHYPMTWQGAKWRQQCLDSFFMGCSNTCHRVFRFTTALFTLDELFVPVGSIWLAD